MGTIDTAILFAYLGLLVGLGFYAQRRKQNVEDYFVAGRRRGPMTIACLLENTVTAALARRKPA